MRICVFLLWLDYFASLFWRRHSYLWRSGLPASMCLCLEHFYQPAQSATILIVKHAMKVSKSNFFRFDIDLWKYCVDFLYFNFMIFVCVWVQFSRDLSISIIPMRRVQCNFTTSTETSSWILQNETDWDILWCVYRTAHGQIWVTDKLFIKILTFSCTAYFMKNKNSEIEIRTIHPKIFDSKLCDN